VTRTPLSRSEGQRSTCRGRGRIVAASAQLVITIIIICHISDH